MPLVHDAKAAGLITTCHTGGASIPGFPGAITGDHLLAHAAARVSFHINGGPTAMPDRDFERVITESDIALQVCTAGNLRTTLLCAMLAHRHGAFDRFLIATDTPTGSGVMPLGMLYTIAHCSSLTDMPPERFICAATGNNARVYGLDLGLLAPGKAADIVLIDAPDGGTQSTALAAIKHGDIAAIGGTHHRRACRVSSAEAAIRRRQYARRALRVRRSCATFPGQDIKLFVGERLHGRQS